MMTELPSSRKASAGKKSLVIFAKERLPKLALKPSYDIALTACLGANTS